MTELLMEEARTAQTPCRVEQIEWRIDLIAHVVDEIETLIEEIPGEDDVDVESLQKLSGTIERLSERFHGGPAGREGDIGDGMALRYLHWLESNVERATRRASQTKGTIWYLPTKHELETFVAARDHFVSLVNGDV